MDSDYRVTEEFEVTVGIAIDANYYRLSPSSLSFTEEWISLWVDLFVLLWSMQILGLCFHPAWFEQAWHYWHCPPSYNWITCGLGIFFMRSRQSISYNGPIGSDEPQLQRTTFTCFSSLDDDETITFQIPQEKTNKDSKFRLYMSSGSSVRNSSSGGN